MACKLEYIITGRNEVVAKVMLLLVSVILLTGGSASVHAGVPPPPEQTPPPRSRHPRSRPHPEQIPPGIRSMSGRGTHPTGMHSCLKSFFPEKNPEPIMNNTNNETEPVASISNVAFSCSLGRLVKPSAASS